MAFHRLDEIDPVVRQFFEGRQIPDRASATIYSQAIFSRRRFNAQSRQLTCSARQALNFHYTSFAGNSHASPSGGPSLPAASSIVASVRAERNSNFAR